MIVDIEKMKVLVVKLCGEDEFLKFIINFYYWE